MLNVRYVLFRGAGPGRPARVCRRRLLGLDESAGVAPGLRARKRGNDRRRPAAAGGDGFGGVRSAASRLRRNARRSAPHLPRHGGDRRRNPQPGHDRAHMQTRGLVVLADLWDKGWNAYLNGRRVPILRANHAVRRVEVPLGEATLEFRYEPASFAWGLWLAAVGLAACGGWLGVGLWRRRAAPLPPPARRRRPGRCSRASLLRQRNHPANAAANGAERTAGHSGHEAGAMPTRAWAWRPAECHLSCVEAVLSLAQAFTGLCKC